jgi:hypothetical protein
MRLLISVGLILMAAPALAENQCIALLKYGIYNTYRAQQSNISDSIINRQICSNYNLYKQHKLQVDASGQYVLVSGSVGFSDDQVEAIGQAMCTQDYSQARAANQIDRFSSVVSQAGLHSFDNCVKNSNAGLIIDIDYDDEASPNIVKMEAKFLPTGVPGTNHLNGVQIVSDASNPSSLKVVCQGTLYTAAKQHEVLNPNISYTMICNRASVNDLKDAFMMLGQELLAAPATVVVETDPGSITFDFPKIPKPSPALSTTSALPCEDSVNLSFCENGGLLTASGTACDDDASWGHWGQPHPIKICEASGSLAMTFYLCSKGGIGTSPNFCNYIHGSISSTLPLRGADSTCAQPQVFFACVNGGAMGTSGNFCYYKNWGELGTMPIRLCTTE